MYKNIKKVRYQRGEKKKETKETSDTIDTHTPENNIYCTKFINKEDRRMLKENSYVFTNKIHKKKTDNVQLIF
jgi:hypothetical protein